MTTQEHALVITMFARQTMFLKTLIHILEGNGITISNDVEPFDLSVQHQEALDLDAFQRTAELYQQVSKILGLDVPVIFPVE